MLAPADQIESAPATADPGARAQVRRCCLFVLGMHRSGTSALSAVLGILGAELGDRLLGPAPDNPKGYFEDGITVGINQFVLDTFFARSIWPRATDWFKSGDLRGSRPRVDETLAYFENNPLFVIKDPRLCLTLPLWLDRGRRRDLDIHLVYTARNPINVVRSLVTRDRINPDIAAVSWFMHTAVALEHGRQYPKVFVSYESLMERTDETLIRLAAFHPGLALSDERRRAVDEFLDAGLQHHRASLEKPEDPILAASMELYAAMSGGDERVVYECFDSPMIQSVYRALLISGMALGRR